MSIFRSDSLILISTLSSISGETNTEANDVWRRLLASNGEIRTSRWTPVSALRYPYGWSPDRRKVALLIPASSPSCRSTSSMAYPFRSANREYIRRSISAQSWDSVPPAPAWIVAMAFSASFSPESIRSSSIASSASSTATNCCSISEVSPSPPASPARARYARRSARDDSRDDQRPRNVPIAFRSRRTRSVASGASQKPSRATSAVSSLRRACFASTSKIAPERLEPRFKRRCFLFHQSGCHGNLAGEK